MTEKICVLFLCLALSFSIQAQDCYQLVWSDEFDIPGAPDASVWGYDLGNSGFGNREVQNYTSNSENVRVENGTLIIEAKKNTGEWTSARVKSQGLKSFTYGKIEFRAKLPAGTGTWPALWMLGENISTVNWPACGEIDIMEHVGKEHGQVHASLHTPSSSGATQNTSTTTVSDVSGTFHIYAVDWDQNKMDFYVDDKLYYTYAPSTKNDNTWPFNKPFFIIMNIAMGGNWGSAPQYETNGLKNGIDPALTSAKMGIDYVRYYSKTEKPKISGNMFIQKDDTTTYSVTVTGATSFNWGVPAGASILQGQNTSQITVKWGTSGGDVSVNVNTLCGNITATPLTIRVLSAPTTDIFTIPSVSNQSNYSWEVVPTPGNTITLSANTDLEINYAITTPSNNPQIKNTLPEILDLSAYKYVSFTLKCEKDNLPAVVRLDLIDINNRNNQDNIFKVTSFSNDEQYHIYSASVSSSSIFNLAAVKELKLYINYSIYPAATGKIWLKEISFLKEKPLWTQSSKLQNTQYIISPNPVKDILNLTPSSNIKDIIIASNNGQQLIPVIENDGDINVNFLPSGVYNMIITDKLNHKNTIRFIKN